MFTFGKILGVITAYILIRILTNRKVRFKDITAILVMQFYAKPAIEQALELTPEQLEQLDYYIDIILGILIIF